MILQVHYDITHAKSKEIQIQPFCHFPSTMGNTIFLVATHHVCHFLPFQCLFASALLQKGRLCLARIIEKGSDLMEKLLRWMEIMKGPQDHKGAFQIHRLLVGT
jgi:hypothetical protein